MKVEAEKQMYNLKVILDRLPEPILITVQNQIQYSNNAYLKVALDDKSDNLISESEEVQSKNSNSIEMQNSQMQLLSENDSSEFLSKLKNTKTEKTLKEVIGKGEQLNKSHFDIKKEDDIKYDFEITSIEIEFSEKQVIVYSLKNLTAFNKIKNLQDREKYQRTYFASITHDFRTPLGIISGSSEILLDLIDDTYQRSQLVNIHQASSMLLLLVQDILDYSQMKAGTLQISPTEFVLEKEFSSLINIFIQKYRDKGLTITLNVDMNVPAKIFNDGNRIKQILMNLISNAYKFTKKGGVEVNVAFNEEVKQIVVYVKDTGVGMDPNDASNLFKEYGKLNRHKDLNPMGIGLGLHICKQLVMKLGGMISVESQVDIGTTFKFSVSSKLQMVRQKY